MTDIDVYIKISLLQSKVLKIEDQGHSNIYVDVAIAKTNDGHYVFNQPSSIDASKLNLTIPAEESSNINYTAKTTAINVDHFQHWQNW